MLCKAIIHELVEQEVFFPEVIKKCTFHRPIINYQLPWHFLKDRIELMIALEVSKMPSARESRKRGKFSKWVLKCGFFRMVTPVTRVSKRHLVIWFRYIMFLQKHSEEIKRFWSHCFSYLKRPVKTICTVDFTKFFQRICETKYLVSYFHTVRSTGFLNVWN